MNINQSNDREIRLPRYMWRYTDNGLMHIESLDKVESLHQGTYRGELKEEDGETLLSINTVVANDKSYPDKSIDTITLRLINIDKDPSAPIEPFSDILSISAENEARHVFEYVEYGKGHSGEKPWRSFADTGDYRAEVTHEVLTLLRLHGVDAQTRTNISRALTQDLISIDDAAQLIADTRYAATQMAVYGFAGLGQTELLADFVGYRIVEKLAPGAARPDRQHPLDISYPRDISSHILADVPGHRQYHKALNDIRSYITDMADKHAGVPTPISREGTAVSDPQLHKYEDNILGYCTVAEYIGIGEESIERGVSQSTKRLGLDPHSQDNRAKGRVVHLLDLLVNEYHPTRIEFLLQDYGYTELLGALARHAGTIRDEVEATWADHSITENKTKNYSVILEEEPQNNKFDFFKRLMEVDGVFSGERARALMEAAPVSVLDTDDEEKALEVSSYLRETGAPISIRNNQKA